LDLINVLIDFPFDSAWQTAIGIVREAAIAGQDDGQT